MDNIIIENFEGKQVYTFMWNGKICWIASSVLSILGYTDTSKSILQCIEAEDFEIGVEYDHLTGKELKLFKELVCDTIPSLKYCARLIIFYEQGLYGFLQFSEKEIAVKFKKWLRREVITSIKKDGEYKLNTIETSCQIDSILSKDDKSNDAKDKLSLETKALINKIKDNVNNESGFDVDKFQRMRVTLEALKFFKPILDEITDNTLYKFEFLKDICTEAGIALPIYVDGDNIL
ncbi:MAG: BRO-N domain-containing protein [Sarcina sp.]